MDLLDGIWRLVGSRAWERGAEQASAPYGPGAMGQIMFANGRMLAALCKGDGDLAADGDRGFSSYGGTYTFDGTTLDTTVDVASDPARIGGHQVRSVVMQGDRMVMRPPMRNYGATVQQREIVWERVWRPLETKEAAQ